VCIPLNPPAPFCLNSNSWSQLPSHTSLPFCRCDASFWQHPIHRKHSLSSFDMVKTDPSKSKSRERLFLELWISLLGAPIAIYHTKWLRCIFLVLRQEVPDQVCRGLVSFNPLSFTSYLFFSFFGGTGLELRALCSQLWCSTAWSMPPVFFCLGYLEIGCFFLSRLAWITILQFYAFHISWDARHVAPPSLFFFLNPGWPQTVILQISDSQVARNISMRHQHRAYPPLFMKNPLILD
jgi:hypothetical protein